MGTLVCFNPLPAFRPGDTTTKSMLATLFGVSIHSRRLGREIRACVADAGYGGIGFNPLPAFRPGDTRGGKLTAPGGAGFNPLPAFRPGDTRTRQTAL